MKIVLASASPRRQQLLTLLGVPFTVHVADVDESLVSDPDPARNVIETARLKGERVASRLQHPALVVASDTTVAIDGDMLNKPADAAEARQMLRRLRGRVHQVFTGLFLLDSATRRSVRDVAAVDVPMRHYSDAEIEAYVASGDPLDKAGAYAIQHPGFQPVARLSGCYAAVMGLPLCHLARALRQFNVATDPDIAARCQAHHQYDCPVHATILAQEIAIQSADNRAA